MEIQLSMLDEWSVLKLQFQTSSFRAPVSVALCVDTMRERKPKRKQTNEQMETKLQLTMCCCWWRTPTPDYNSIKIYMLPIRIRAMGGSANSETPSPA